MKRTSPPTDHGPPKKRYREETNDSLSCSVCMDVFKDPRVLPCGHSFCLVCIPISTHGIKCPICRREIKAIPSNLPKNFTLQDIISRQEEALAEDPTPISCNLCGGNASHCCKNCHKYLCSGCVKEHNAHPFSKYHVVTDLSAVSWCFSHSKKKIKYCLSCSQFICTECKCFTEFGHRVVSIANAADSKRAVIFNLLKTDLFERKAKIHSAKSKEKEEARRKIEIQIKQLEIERDALSESISIQKSQFLSALETKKTIEAKVNAIHPEQLLLPESFNSSATELRNEFSVSITGATIVVNQANT